SANGTSTNASVHVSIPDAAFKVLYSVVAVVLLQGTDALALPDTEYDFTDAVAKSLGPAKASVERNNVTLANRNVVVNGTSFVETTIGVADSSIDAMTPRTRSSSP
ncbi:hypothetical protein As57867_007469, partial [Aphanomyces stellatus]